ncbi:hypothetical protein L1887_12535 [Cichorium endivia]|nr:hypothetical protein L1887_12535 [Cichorium endivia]
MFAEKANAGASDVRLIAVPHHNATAGTWGGNEDVTVYLLGMVATAVKIGEIFVGYNGRQLKIGDLLTYST